MPPLLDASVSHRAETCSLLFTQIRLGVGSLVIYLAGYFNLGFSFFLIVLAGMYMMERQNRENMVEREARKVEYKQFQRAVSEGTESSRPSRNTNPCASLPRLSEPGALSSGQVVLEAAVHGMARV